MQLTPNYRLRKPDGTDPVDVQDLNDNMDVLDAEVVKKLDKTGDASNVVNKFSQAGTRTNLSSGEKLSITLGKIMKWFADFAKVAFSGNYADLTGRPTIPAGGIADASKVIDNLDDIAANTQAGYMAGALAVKELNSDLGALNDGGAIQGLEVREGDGVYITYTDGADTVSKKLGSYVVANADFTLTGSSVHVAHITLANSIDAGIIIAYGGWQSGVSWISAASISVGQIETLVNARAWGGSTAIYVGLIRDATSKTVITFNGNDLVNGGSDWFHVKVVKFI